MTSSLLLRYIPQLYFTQQFNYCFEYGPIMGVELDLIRSRVRRVYIDIPI